MCLYQHIRCPKRLFKPCRVSCYYRVVPKEGRLKYWLRGRLGRVGTSPKSIIDRRRGPARRRTIRPRLKGRKQNPQKSRIRTIRLRKRWSCTGVNLPGKEYKRNRQNRRELRTDNSIHLVFYSFLSRAQPNPARSVPAV